MNEDELVSRDADKILQQIKKEETRQAEGKLRIFFGMCAGVGKTYGMLQMAQQLKSTGVDVVVGVVETHKRVETQNLVEGLELIPLKSLSYRNANFYEMDIDAIIKRRPKLVLVDELAHTNIPGSRHTKRYQDVQEILASGIDVFTTLNVQHIESRCKVVREITGVQIRETVPDSILERADDIELIDLTPEELLQRLREGKVYTEEKSKKSVDNFFRKGNLTALREMALRITAERVEKDLHEYRAEKKISGVWKSSQKLLVSVGPGPHSADLIRWTRHLAYAMEVPWVAGHVETDKEIKPEFQESLTKNIELARELGAEVITIQDIDVAQGLLKIARVNNVTQILIGKTRRNYYDILFRRKNIIDALIKQSGNIDVSVIGGDEHKQRSFFNPYILLKYASTTRYLLAIAIIAVLTAVLYLTHQNIGYQTVSLIYLFTILLMSLFDFGPGPIIVACMLSAYNWNFFFIPPAFTLWISKFEDIVMFCMYFIVAAVAGYYTSRIRSQQVLLDRREKRTVSLYMLLKDLTSSANIDEVVESAVYHLGEVFNAKVAVVLVDEANKLHPQTHSASSFFLNDSEWLVANWTFNNAKKAGENTNTLPFAQGTYYPIRSKSGIYGVFGLSTESKEKKSLEIDMLLDTFLAQISVAIEREYLNTIAKNNLIHLETERLYSTLFDSISHELKTPITTIKSAVETFNDVNNLQNEKLRTNLVKEMDIAVFRLTKLVDNLLDMTRVESKQMHLKLAPHTVMDLINSVLDKMEIEAHGRVIKVEHKDEEQFVNCDFALLEHAILNIVRNAAEYTPSDSEIFIKTGKIDGGTFISIADNGGGVPQDSLEKIFDKFHREPGMKTGGMGLGLSITKGFVEAHGGKITAVNRETGGLEFIIYLP